MSSVTSKNIQQKGYAVRVFSPIKSILVSSLVNEKFRTDTHFNECPGAK